MTTFHDLFKPAADDFQVGDGATILGWTDRYAMTVIKRTARTITLQEDKVRFGATADDIAGANDRDVAYEPDPFGRIRVARLTTKNGVTGWRSQGQKVVAGRHYYRDPSF